MQRIVASSLTVLCLWLLMGCAAPSAERSAITNQLVADASAPSAAQDTAPAEVPGVAPPEVLGDPAQVGAIVDGDTIDVVINGQEYRVRYILMNTPERGEPFFSEATEANRQLVGGKTVYLQKDVSETDRYGRLLRYVYLEDGTFVNVELVRQGYAQIATFPPDVSKEAEIRAAQQEAMAAQRGLWAGESVPAGPVANGNANLRSGPGTEYEIVGGVSAGESLTIEGVNEAGDWYLLASGAWVFGDLVDGAPANPQVVVSGSQTQTSAPQVAQTEPTGTATVVIQSVYYDGVVPRVESDEYAVIANTGTAPQDITGWRLNAGDRGQDFVFPNYTLAPGESCRVYTNEIHPETCGFSFGISKAIWANSGDCGYLYDANGVEVSSYCY